MLRKKLPNIDDKSTKKTTTEGAKDIAHRYDSQSYNLTASEAHAMKTKYQTRFALNECSKRLKQAKTKNTFSERRIIFEEGVLFALSWVLEDINTTL